MPQSSGKAFDRHWKPRNKSPDLGFTAIHYNEPQVCISGSF